MRFSETLRGIIILGFSFGTPFTIIWFLFERLENILKDGHNPVLQLNTLLSNKNFSDIPVINSITNYLDSTQMFQWDFTQTIVSWIKIAHHFIMSSPIELWIFVSWPILNWIGYKLSKFKRRTN